MGHNRCLPLTLLVIKRQNKIWWVDYFLFISLSWNSFASNISRICYKFFVSLFILFCCKFLHMIHTRCSHGRKKLKSIFAAFETLWFSKRQKNVIVFGNAIQVLYILACGLFSGEWWSTKKSIDEGHGTTSPESRSQWTGGIT